MGPVSIFITQVKTLDQKGGSLAQVRQLITARLGFDPGQSLPGVAALVHSALPRLLQGRVIYFIHFLCPLETLAQHLRKVGFEFV